MSLERNQIIEQLFEAAIALPTDERRLFLERQASDPRIAAEVEALLEADFEGGRTEALPIRLANSPSTSRDVTLPERIGSYTLVDKLGEGGMGIVYRAAQESPIRREVAIKVIRVGPHDSSALSRFEAERQVLALLNHPNIAKVFEAGTTAEGAPYFVMELIQGVPITDYLGATDLSVREKIRLSIQVAKALQHAHQRGVIHRDIKPSNVLVTQRDGAAVPVVIDFGIAKVFEGPEFSPELTKTHQIIGTPNYMSPEQLRLSGAAVDTRSDVYALGVLLYELVTGTPPYDFNSRESQSLYAIQKIITEREPERPSDRIRTDSKTRKVNTTRSRSQSIKRDLDWVIMKCLEKDPNRRYDTVAELTTDLERYLNYEPVSAGPPTAFYRIRKLVRRHRLFFSSLGIVFLCLATGLTTSLIFFRTAEHQRQLAERRLKSNERVVETMTKIFASPDPDLDGREVKVAEILDRASHELASSLAEEPEVEALVRTAIGKSYLGLGAYKDARQEFDRVIRLTEKTQQFGLDQAARLDCARTMILLGEYREALEVLGKLEADRLPHQEIGRLELLKAEALGRLGEYGEAERLFELALDGLRDSSESFPLEALRAERKYADYWEHRGNNKEAQARLESLRTTFKRAGRADHSEYFEVLDTLASIHANRGDWDQAYDEAEIAYELRRKHLGDLHPATLESLSNLARIASEGGPGDPDQLHRLAVASFREQLGDEHEKTLIARLNYVDHRASACELSSQSLPELEHEMRSIVSSFESLEGQIEFTLLARHHLAELYWQAGFPQEARPIYERVYLECLEVLGAQNPDRAVYAATYARCLMRLKEFGGVTEMLESAFEVLIGEYGAQHPYTLETARMLNRLYFTNQQMDKFQELAERLRRGN